MGVVFDARLVARALVVTVVTRRRKVLWCREWFFVVCPRCVVVMKLKDLEYDAFQSKELEGGEVIEVLSVWASG